MALTPAELTLVRTAVRLARGNSPAALAAGDLAAQNLYLADHFFTTDPVSGVSFEKSDAPQFSAYTNYQTKTGAERISFWLAIGTALEKLEEVNFGDILAKPLEVVGGWLRVVIGLVVAGVALVFFVVVLVIATRSSR